MTARLRSALSAEVEHLAGEWRASLRSARCAAPRPAASRRHRRRRRGGRRRSPPAPPTGAAVAFEHAQRRRLAGGPQRQRAVVAGGDGALAAVEQLHGGDVAAVAAPHASPSRPPCRARGAPRSSRARPSVVEPLGLDRLELRQRGVDIAAAPEQLGDQRGRARDRRAGAWRRAATAARNAASLSSPRLQPTRPAL